MLASTLNSKAPSPSIGVKQHPQHIPDAEVNNQSIKIQMVEEVEEDHYTPSQNPGDEDI
jgi:hypothetical protein